MLMLSKAASWLGGWRKGELLLYEAASGDWSDRERATLAQRKTRRMVLCPIEEEEIGSRQTCPWTNVE